MKKLLLFFGFFLAYSFVTYAAWRENLPIKVTQPDGEVLNCFATGDEFYTRVHDSEGYTLIRDPNTGYVVYADLRNDELVSTGNRVGRNYTRPGGLSPGITISAQKREKLRNDFLNAVPKRERKRPQSSSGEISNVGQNNGTINNIVIYIRFADDAEFPADANVYEDMFNTATTSNSASLYNYFKTVSHQQTLIPSTFYPAHSGNTITSYQDTYVRSYFEEYNASTNPNGYKETERTEREHQLLERAILSVKSQIEASGLIFDFLDPGYIDNICFIVKGNPLGTTDPWSTLLWPHKWALYSEVVTIGGKRVWDYNFQIEIQMDPSVLAHEMFHTLSAPDLYRYDDKTITPVGIWDLMASDVLQSSTAWIKYKYGGWIADIPEITTSGTYTLNNVMSPTNYAYKIASPTSTKGEFFVFEYRDMNVFPDANISKYSGYSNASGLIIYRINETDAPRGNADGPPDELYIYRPGGGNTVNGTINLANFSSNVSRTTFSAPNYGFLTNNGEGLGGIYIEDIGASGGTTMSFKVVFPDKPISIAAIDGVTPPVAGATPATTIVETAQYTGTIAWSPVDATFDYSTIYTATITLTPKTGFILTGVAANFFTVAGTSSPAINLANSGVITAVFPATGAPTTINIAAIDGVTPPVVGATPATTIVETAQYTGKIVWSPADATFDYSTTYTATITLTPKTGFTLTGIPANFFTVAGSSFPATNSANSGVIMAEFPMTGAAATTINIAAIDGVTPPVAGATPATAIIETAQYTGTIVWSPADVTFANTTTYNATITLTQKTDFTLTGVAANFFTVAGTSSPATNLANSGVITAVFPATGTARKPGDVTGDGTLDLFDILAIINHINGDIILTGDALIAADVNNNGTIDLFDILAIINHINGDILLW